MYKIYDIANLKVAIKDPFGRIEKQGIPYLAKDQSQKQKVDIIISISDEKIQKAMQQEGNVLNEDDWFYLLSGADFYIQLIRFNGILLHSSCVVVDGYAYAFSADSGTGKSTHTNLWMNKFKDKIYMLNDDKPALREFDGKIYACGTPWSGKSDYSTPAIVPLAGIAFLERSETNWIKKADTSLAIFNAFSQSTRKLNEKYMPQFLDNLENIFNKVKIYQFGCNISDEAVDVSYNAMKPKE